MRPFIKWPGGKEHELQYILPAKPSLIRNYVEPFLGGGAVFLALTDEEVTGKFIVNDLSNELIDTYRFIQENNVEFYNEMEVIDQNNKLMVDLVSHNLERIRVLYGNISKIVNDEINNILKVEDGKKLVQNVSENSLKEIADNRKKIVKQAIKNVTEQRNLEINNFITNVVCDNVLVGNLNRDISSFRINVKNMLIRRINRAIIRSFVNVGEAERNLSDIFECVFKASLYTHIRSQYNQRHKGDCPYTQAEMSAMYLYIRENCYAAMHRTNELGEFNVPYGGISYNCHNFGRKKLVVQSKDLHRRLIRTEFNNLDFEKFLEAILDTTTSEDFWFIDPPYDSAFSEYSQNKFGIKDHIRLANLLVKTRAKVMIVIKKTDFIYNLYSQYENFRIGVFSKMYGVNFVNRNEREVEHLIITNYDVEMRNVVETQEVTR